MLTLERLCRFPIQKVIDIGQYLLKLFENFEGLQVFLITVVICPYNGIWQNIQDIWL